MVKWRSKIVQQTNTAKRWKKRGRLKSKRQGLLSFAWKFRINSSTVIIGFMTQITKLFSYSIWLKIVEWKKKTPKNTIKKYLHNGWLQKLHFAICIESGSVSFSLQNSIVHVCLCFVYWIGNFEYLSVATTTVATVPNRACPNVALERAFHEYVCMET